MDLLEAHGALPYVVIDLSIVRGLAYYTGFVYEAFEASGEGRALAGGGRYDHLLKKLSGNVDLPACGFAIGDMTLSDCLAAKGLTPNYITARISMSLREKHRRIWVSLWPPKLVRQGFQLPIPSKRLGLENNLRTRGNPVLGTH